MFFYFSEYARNVAVLQLLKAEVLQLFEALVKAALPQLFEDQILVAKAVILQLLKAEVLQLFLSASKSRTAKVLPAKNSRHRQVIAFR